jgi:hypothetical protein
MANTRRISEKNELQRSDALALVDGDIALLATADKISSARAPRQHAISAMNTIDDRTFAPRDVLLKHAGVSGANGSGRHRQAKLAALAGSPLR